MLLKTSEFLDSLCKAGPVGKGWYLINVQNYGVYVWKEHLKEEVFKINNVDIWLEEQGIIGNDNNEVTTCTVRNVIDKRAKIKPPSEQTVELWLNIIIPSNLKDGIRVESYTDQHAALLDAEQELTISLEVHTKFLKVQIP